MSQSEFFNDQHRFVSHVDCNLNAFFVSFEPERKEQQSIILIEIVIYVMHQRIVITIKIDLNSNINFVFRTKRSDFYT